ncbi:flp pilus-assembly TadE/G-like family protein [Nesterenkonia sp. LB17]|uniref:Rv3654c family TadE-like protein n=1 Tax=unclassified Nesterenkonia TaxID=2629769 RepID=UPI001F4C7C80|nr:MULTISPECIES: Rv3654c family TadE-like protein [unclassified Nesterenkonia]MCH8561518.1 flp pilus-assembly TadE/G-like family protein [Nesterenkonia sp. DZ6]MCH8566367.1 flp pilus-assembly TadE/G-like family protein [Nesterenkonia sp. LB17]
MRPRVSLSEERGSGTVLALGLIMVLLILLAAAQTLSMVAASSAQAARGADLAALAGADAARGLSTGSPCTVAEAVAARNAVELTSCTVTGEYRTEVLVSTVVPILPERLLDAGGVDLSGLLSRGAARAGPPP